MKEGEVYFAEIKDPKGNEIQKDRPVIIIRNFTGYNLVFVVPVSTGENRFLEPFNVPIPKTPDNGLDEDSVAITYQSTSISKKRLIKKLGEVDKESFELVKENLKNLLKL
jgi:mRNA interferase MazF